MLTTYGAVTGSPLARPKYPSTLLAMSNTAEWVREYAGYASQIKRICGDAGVAIPVVGGKWHTPWARHRYSKRNPWSSDGLKILIDQKDGGDPARLVLDSATMTPLWSSRDGDARAEKLRTSSEVQWRPGFPTQMVSVRNGTAANTVEVEVWDTATTSGTRVGSLMVIPTTASGSFPAELGKATALGWSSEGTISDDGNWTVLSTRLGNSASSTTTRPQQDTSKHDYLVVLNLSTGVVGARVDISSFTQAYPSSTWGLIDYCNISCSGLFVEVRLSGDGGRSGYNSGDPYGFILNVAQGSAGYPCTAHGMDATSAALRMGPTAAQGAAGAALGLTPWLSHADFNIDSAGNEVIVGGARIPPAGDTHNGCNFASDTFKKYGDAIMVNLTTGIHTHVGPGSMQVNEGSLRFAQVQHTSGRCTGRRGWQVVTTDISNRGAIEVMWMRLLATNTPGGTRSIERLCKLRTDDAGRYYAEAHAVAKPDGSQVMFASNWQGIDANPPGVIGDSKSYIVSNTITAPAPTAGKGPYGPYFITEP